MDSLQDYASDPEEEKHPTRQHEEQPTKRRRTHQDTTTGVVSLISPALAPRQRYVSKREKERMQEEKERNKKPEIEKHGVEVDLSKAPQRIQQELDSGGCSPSGTIIGQLPGMRVVTDCDVQYRKSYSDLGGAFGWDQLYSVVPSSWLVCGNSSNGSNNQTVGRFWHATVCADSQKT